MPLAVGSAVPLQIISFCGFMVPSSCLQHEKRPGGVRLRIRRDFPSTAPMMWGLVLHGIELEFADDSL